MLPSPPEQALPSTWLHEDSRLVQPFLCRSQARADHHVSWDFRCCSCFNPSTWVLPIHGWHAWLWSLLVPKHCGRPDTTPAMAVWFSNALLMSAEWQPSDDKAIQCKRPGMKVAMMQHGVRPIVAWCLPAWKSIVFLILQGFASCNKSRGDPWRWNLLMRSHQQLT